LKLHKDKLSLTVTDKIINFPASTSLNVDQALASAAQLNMTDVLIIGYVGNGLLKIRSSKMDRKNALWLIESAKREIFSDE